MILNIHVNNKNVMTTFKHSDIINFLEIFKVNDIIKNINDYNKYAKKEDRVNILKCFIKIHYFVNSMLSKIYNLHRITVSERVLLLDDMKSFVRKASDMISEVSDYFRNKYKLENFNYDEELGITPWNGDKDDIDRYDQESKQAFTRIANNEIPLHERFNKRTFIYFRIYEILVDITINSGVGHPLSETYMNINVNNIIYDL